MGTENKPEDRKVYLWEDENFTLFQDDCCDNISQNDGLHQERFS